MAGAATLTFTEQNYQSEVAESAVPVMIDFWAEWCQPCRMIGPSIDQLAIEYQGKAKVGKVDIEPNRNLALQFNILQQGAHNAGISQVNAGGLNLGSFQAIKRQKQNFKVSFQTRMAINFSTKLKRLTRGMRCSGSSV